VALEDDLAQRVELRRALRTLREQREADEKVAARLDRVLEEIAQVRRDRDAEMSEELDQARREIDKACIDAEELAVAVSRLWTRIQVAELGEGDPRMRAAQRVVEEDVQEAMGAFVAAVNADEEPVE
jgi:hypothetical protein